MSSKIIPIYPSQTTQSFYSPSNNDASLKNIYFHLKDQSGVTLDGEGAEYIFNGSISPIVVDHCRDVVIKNLTIDYPRPFFTQAEIVESSSQHVLLRIPPEFTYKFGPNGLIFTGSGWESRLETVTSLVQEYDPATMAPAYNAPVLLVNIGETSHPSPSASMPSRHLRSRDAGEGLVELIGDLGYVPRVGNFWLLSHEDRRDSGIFVVDSENIRIENVHIRHAPSMGVIAQTTRNITLQNVTTLPGPGRMLSVNADSTHFVNCSGLIKIENCRFENMLDDGVNIHGIYTRVESVDNDHITLRYMHCQQRAANIYRPGDEIVITRGNTCEEVERLIVADARSDDPALVTLRLASPAQRAQKGDLAENRDRMPEVEIRNTRVANNRPRAFLISTTKRALVEDCEMSNCHFGIHIAGDCTYWYESGGVTNLTIRRNRFVNCNYQAGEYALGITPEYEPTGKAPCFHKNITVEDNDFYAFTDGMMYARGVDGLIFRGNRYHRTEAYPKRENAQRVLLENCRNAVIEPPSED